MPQKGEFVIEEFVTDSLTVWMAPEMNVKRIPKKRLDGKRAKITVFLYGLQKGSHCYVLSSSFV